MSEFASALTMIAPYYNLVLVLIVLYMFIQLFKTSEDNEDVYIKPWVYIFAAVVMFILEEIITVLRAIGAVEIGRQINGFFEFIIIILFVYALVLQKQYLKEAFSHPVVEVKSAPKKAK